MIPSVFFLLSTSASTSIRNDVIRDSLFLLSAVLNGIFYALSFYEVCGYGEVIPAYRYGYIVISYYYLLELIICLIASKKIRQLIIALMLLVVSTLFFYFAVLPLDVVRLRNLALIDMIFLPFAIVFAVVVYGFKAPSSKK